MASEHGAEHSPTDTSVESYAQRLAEKESAWWKRALDVQRPYRWNLRRQQLGRTLDVGCGIGRNLETLPPGSLGVDHNAASITIARQRGLNAMTVAEFQASEESVPERFDAILLAHVIEHMDAQDGEAILRMYLPSLRPGGKVFFVCPQERGYRSDPTHVRFTDGDALAELARTVGLVPDRWYSFPLPRWTGKVFTYNEFCLSARKPDPATA